MAATKAAACAASDDQLMPLFAFASLVKVASMVKKA